MVRTTARRAMARRRAPVRRRRSAMARRRNPLIVNRKRRRSTKRRRNPSMASITAPIQKMVKKLPVVGGFLSNVVGFAGPAALGAVSVYPTLAAMKYAGGYIPERLQPFSFTIVGTVLAALVGTVTTKLKIGSPSLRGKTSRPPWLRLAARWTSTAGSRVSPRSSRWRPPRRRAWVPWAATAVAMATGVVPYSGLQNRAGSVPRCPGDRW